MACKIWTCHWLLKIAVLLFGLVLFCEVFLYYVVLIQCTWPLLNVSINDPTLKVMLLADTHLLGSRNGHWFDKLRREWQMYRAFQTTMLLHNPDVVFILGDVFDEGLWCSDTEFKYYVDRFASLFHVPQNTKLHVVVGNHDVGFHYRITKPHLERFEAAFNVESVKLIEEKGIFFVTLNSMAMEEDGCKLCRAAENKIKDISKALNCLKKPGNKCLGNNIKLTSGKYSRPFLLQHFPLYRPSDATCIEPDSAPPEKIKDTFREKWDCLSQSASDRILNAFDPRAAFSGHTHHGCYFVHKYNIPEWTIASFSWRNKKNPSFLLASVTEDNFAINKCYMPRETTVYLLYIIGTFLIFLWTCFFKRKFKFQSLKDNK